ncbi:hypothetical protein THAOC_14709 [Thalassiosira oceanica]|uniref:Carboxypeptidase n=1 Tax=Thalassiosira oceanica TaxID=159749 RepID=K0SHU3_THAOC|nr:hypothetical protein THAOC_14709 [Thalassiosira oceanica]|eukprot:EJK64554.1 hypothetical protein THAOC_14709 [Thalassiosira oceanica]
MDEVPLILWLNGGPGCSSMDGLWLENGPLRLKPGQNSWTIEINPYSWHRAPAWTLYVDQPVGTGLSFSRKGKYCKNDFEVNRDFHYFLEEFLLLHKDKFLSENSQSAEYVLRTPFYFSGESHAGHYIPSMMDFILQRNEGGLADRGLTPMRVEIPLSGAAIGNGWTDPYHQYAAADAAFGAGLIGSAQRASLEDKERQCQSKLKSGVYKSGICFALLDDIVDESSGRSGHSVVSQYDTRLWESKGASRDFPHGHKTVETYLSGSGHRSTSPPLNINYKDVLKAIHATEAIDAGQQYEECTDPPYLALSHQDGLGVVDELVRVLDHKSKPHILFFNGINDLICNHVGNEKMLNSLPWSQTSQFVMAQRHAWLAAGVSSGEKINYIEGRPDGYVKEQDNLSFLKVIESGHMVPMDQPAVALSMVRTLLHRGGKGFLSSAQQLQRANTNPSARMCLLDQCPSCEISLPCDTEVNLAGDVESTTIGVDSITGLPAVPLASVGTFVAAFLAGILLTCFIQRRKSASDSKRELVSLQQNGHNLELAELDDDSYSDHPEDREFT